MAANDDDGVPNLCTDDDDDYAMDDDDDDDDDDYVMDDDDDDHDIDDDGILYTEFRRPPPRPETLLDILFKHVFPFLPVRPLLRLRATHPEWHRRLSSPIFSHLQTLSNRSFSGLFSCDPPSFYIPFHPSSDHALPDPHLFFLPYSSPHVLASSGGLLCCSITRCGRGLVVCNPATMDFTELPLAPYGIDAIALEFTPCLRNIAGEYRIICISLIIDLKEGKLEYYFAVFDSGNGSWRSSKPRMKDDHPTVLISPHGVCAGGKAYWSTLDGSILRYDPDSDGLSIMGVPEEAEDAWAVWQLGEFGGMLCCVSASQVTSDVVVAVLMDGGDGKRWERLRHFSVDGGLYVQPLTLTGGNGEVVVWVEGSVMGFSIATGERRVLCDAAESPVLETAVLLPYVSTFAFVKKFRGMNMARHVTLN